jgi:hypothetical protein
MDAGIGGEWDGLHLGADRRQRLEWMLMAVGIEDATAALSPDGIGANGQPHREMACRAGPRWGYPWPGLVMEAWRGTGEADVEAVIIGRQPAPRDSPSMRQSRC